MNADQRRPARRQFLRDAALGMNPVGVGHNAQERSEHPDTGRVRNG